MRDEHQRLVSSEFPDRLGDEIRVLRPVRRFDTAQRRERRPVVRAMPRLVVRKASLSATQAEDLAYVVEGERFQAKVGGSEETASGALRVTSILRREDGAWKILHRHADPITTVRPAASVIQK